MAFTAVFDACVLYPAPLRDLLMWLASTNLFRARWSDRIHEEWIRGVLRQRPELEVSLQRTRRAMDRVVSNCIVEGYEDLITTLDLPDPHDRHVLAVAITSRADVIVTSNLKHFPIGSLQSFGIKAQHPDVFVRLVLDLDTAVALSAMRDHRANLVKPCKTTDEYIETLARQGLPETVAFLRPWAALI